MELSIVILAAGQGKRMHSSVPKVLQPLAGKPLLEHVVNTAQTLKPKQIIVVYGNGGSHVRESMAHLPVEWVEQEHRLGTGHAVAQALPLIADKQQVLVLYGDVPLISTATLETLLQTAKNNLGIITAELTNPTGYGRIIRNAKKQMTAIIEHKDANKKQLAITEINTGILTAPAKQLKKWLPKIKNKNSQGEYYLTDAIAIAVADRVKIASVLANPVEEVQGINDHAELAKLERYYQLQFARKLLLQGVTLMDPARLDVRGELSVGKDVVIDVNVIIEGKVKIGSGVKIGPNNILRNIEIGDNTEILANCVLEESTVGNACKIGPFSRLRPGCELASEVHIGAFVELKKSKLAARSKANHLAYIGDAIVGKDVNIGAGVITCNYDGVNKHQTIIEDGAFIGSDCPLIAPVIIGKNAYIAAGSTINKNAPAEQLTIARSKQITIPGWKPPKKKS